MILGCIFVEQKLLHAGLNSGWGMDFQARGPTKVPILLPKLLGAPKGGEMGQQPYQPPMGTPN